MFLICIVIELSSRLKVCKEQKSAKSVFVCFAKHRDDRFKKLFANKTEVVSTQILGTKERRGLFTYILRIIIISCVCAVRLGRVEKKKP